MDKYIYGYLVEHETLWDRWVFNSKHQERTMCRDYELIECLDMLGEDGWQLIMFDEKNKEYIFKKKGSNRLI